MVRRKKFNAEKLRFHFVFIVLFTLSFLSYSQDLNLCDRDIDHKLTRTLDSIYLADQNCRMQLDSVMNEFGWKSAEVKAHWEIIHKTDSLNQIIVRKIINEHGWLGPDRIGEKANKTLFLVIQHADLETQLEYIPIMREAVKKGNAKARNLALLEDRTALKQGEFQIYGSQIWTNPETGELFVAALKDPQNVDKRRAEVGLEPLSSYLKQWQLEWNVEDYLKKLPEYERLLNMTHKNFDD